MNGSCCLWGQTEHNTIENSLEWSASFLEKYCTETINLYDVLRCIYNLSADGGSTIDVATRLNTIATIAKGAIADTITHIDFNDNSDELARRVRNSAREMTQQMRGETHIPIHGISKYNLQEKLGTPLDDTDDVKHIIVHIKGNNRSFLGKRTYECHEEIKNQIDAELKSISSTASEDFAVDKIRLLLVFNDCKLAERLEREKIFQQIREEFPTLTIEILYINIGVNWYNEVCNTAIGNTFESNSNADNTKVVYSPPSTELDMAGDISTLGGIA